MAMTRLLPQPARSLVACVALVRAFRRSPTEVLDVLVASGAGRAPVRIGPERVLLVHDPAEVWELLTTHARATGKGRGLVRARPLLGEGLLTSEGDRHRQARRGLQPAFTAPQVAGYRPGFAAAAERAAARWSDGGEVDLVAEMSALTLDGVGATLFGADLSTAAPRITSALTTLLAGFRLAMAPGGARLLRSSLPAAVRLRAAQAKLEQIVDDLVRVGRGPVLTRLAGRPATEVRDEVMTLLLAGHETTAMALTWALAALDRLPAVRAGLEAEWDALPAESSTWDGPVYALPRTMAVLAETLRLWPPSWLFSRRVRGPVRLGGRPVPAGTMCLVSPALLHRDPRWWTEPGRFRPDRWLHAGADGTERFDPKAPGQPRGAYLPFGAGPRRCIGEQFAWAEAATLLAVLGRSWRLRLADAPLTVGPASMTLRPAGRVRAVTAARA